ncbi:hypothetical protein BBK36DRAFT_18265 [Trichoderma citrinoviride]|uniref:Uncharacterized protein n=1 Tax=Trichoderma citrinoviride TaxID=58853 RepID=A0A2T4BES8_9HYPO|nr:hypothetical protein BBK36DRAFT_18265 [Trichoderma citrinoviride]PTB67840.1 hypothetical protein BBK36DRAFT_18265 [Trichoderma citrinoviride]
MATSFSLEEKRFVLAEMIKCSTVDIERLARFVEVNVLDPKWITMQIPSGRNLEQCMQVADSLSSAPGYRSAMSQNDHLTGSSMNHARQMAPRMSPGGQTPGAMPTSPGLMSPWQQHPDGVEDRRVHALEAPPGDQAPKKRGRPPRVDRKTAAPPRLANIAPKPPPLSPGPNTPRTILPATPRQAEAQNPQPQPSARALPPLDSPPARKKRRTATGATSVTTSPPLPPASAPAPAPASAPASAPAPAPAPAPARAPTPYLPLVTTPPPSLDHGNRPRAPPETISTISRETEQIQPPRPIPLEPEPRHHTLMPVGSAAPPSQIKA